MDIHSAITEQKYYNVNACVMHMQKANSKLSLSAQETVSLFNLSAWASCIQFFKHTQYSHKEQLTAYMLSKLSGEARAVSKKNLFAKIVQCRWRFNEIVRVL